MSDSELIPKFEKHFTKKRVAPGHVIFHEGEPVDAAYIVQRGDVQICTMNEKEEMVHLTTMRMGQVFGDLALINDGKRTATALTEKGCELLVVRREQLASLLQKADPFLRFWIEYLGERVIELSKRVT